MSTIIYRSKSLDALRGIFACIVVLMHIDIISVFKNFSIINHAYVFVDFFFVLSAFVLYNSYKKNTKISIFVLLKRRVFRLIPLHFFMLFLFLIFEIFKKFVIESQFNLDTHSFTNETSITSFIASLFLFDSFGLFDHNIWNAPAWSISAEFYSFIIFVLIDKLRTRLRLFFFLVLGILLFVFCFNYGTVDYGQNFGIFRCLWSYFIVLFMSETKLYLKLLGNIFLFGSISLVFIYFFNTETLHFFEFLLPFPFAIIVFNVYFKRLKFLDFSFINKIGELSYSIYLSQALIIIILDDLLLIFANKFDKIYFVKNHLFYFQNQFISSIFTVITLIIILVFSYFINKYVENILMNNSNNLKLSKVEKK